MEARFSNILKATNVTKLTKVILESCYRVLQVTCKPKTVNQSLYLLRAVEIWATFDIQTDIIFAIFWKTLQNYTF